MEVYEMPITVEESRNYHKLLYQLKALKLLLFVVVFFLVALQRSKNMQLKAMLQKYFINNIPQEFLSGGIQLKKIKVSKNSLKVYYRRFHTQDFK